jgi:hypothetical protein
MKTIFATSTIVLAVLLSFSGCATPSAPSKGAALNGEVSHVGKMAPLATHVALKVQADGLHIAFPALQNNTGENFATTPCAATFEYVGASTNTMLDTATAVYKGSFDANNNCALFTQQPSTSYDLATFTQYAMIETSSAGTTFTIAQDMAGKMPIITGSVQ